MAGSFVLLLAAICLAGGGCGRDQTRIPHGPLLHEAYIWQRSYTSGLKQAITLHGTNFSRLVVLSADVSWIEDAPRSARAGIDYPSLRKAGVPVGIALRIGSCSPRVMEAASTYTYLERVAAELIREARASSVNPVELQLDFDCAESRLESYRKLVGVLRKRIAPTPLVITALPSWLDRSAFARLAKATDGYVLQVHSLERPKTIEDPMSLCDPDLARRAVAKTSKLGVPFRVALPTYSYLIAFDAKGRFKGLAAENARRNVSDGARVVELKSDPMAMAGLVAGWRSNSPPDMLGVIWYRFPSPDDTLNWRWPTLGAIVQDGFPRISFRAESRRVEPELREVILVNDGEIDISSRLLLKASWDGARLVAADALRGFEIIERSPGGVTFRSRAALACEAGQMRVAGWLRLDQDCEVRIEIGEW